MPSPMRQWLYFNPRSPCGERLMDAFSNAAMVIFQSTLPVWGATIRHGGGLHRVHISIHAPRVGSDDNRVFPGRLRGISIHAPRVGSDADTVRVLCVLIISIHAPRVGSDQFPAGRCSSPHDFNPRSPCGERRPHLLSRGGASLISIHAPRVGSDC